MRHDLHGAAVARVAPDGQVVAEHAASDLHRHPQTDDERHVRALRRSGHRARQEENKGTSFYNHQIHQWLLRVCLHLVKANVKAMPLSDKFLEENKCIVHIDWWQISKNYLSFAQCKRHPLSVKSSHFPFAVHRTLPNTMS